MPKYSYTVINQEGQKLTGTIEADSEDASRENLSKLGFPILDITEITQSAKSDGEAEISKKFEFQAVDQNGRKVVGTVAAEDMYAAFKRLISEYHFAVEQLFPSDISPEAKEEQKKRGVVELYTKLKNEQEKSGVNSKSAEEQATINQEQEQQNLLQQIDFVLQKIQSLLQDFDDIIKPEDKNIIKSKADRLIRLKSSKNTEYVRHLADDLLLYIQNEEIFLVREKNDKKVQSFRLDVKKLMNHIHQEKINITLRQDILNATSEWISSHLKNNPEPSWWEKSIGNIMNFIENLLTEPPEVASLKDKIRVMNGQVWDYYKMYIKEDTIEGRKEIKESIRALKEQRSELKLELKRLQNKFAEEAVLPSEKTEGNKILSELTSITGWLFAIYFTLHVVHIYISTRELPFQISANAIKISQTRNFEMSMLILLIVHAGLRIKSMFVVKKTLGTIIVIPAISVSILLIAYNL